MRSENCYFYDLSDKFKFGKHRGQSLCDVIADDPTYIHWCVDTIPDFVFNEALIQQIKELFPQFIISEHFTTYKLF